MEKLIYIYMNIKIQLNNIQKLVYIIGGCVKCKAELR